MYKLKENIVKILFINLVLYLVAVWITSFRRLFKHSLSLQNAVKIYFFQLLKLEMDEFTETLKTSAARSKK